MADPGQLAAQLLEQMQQSGTSAEALRLLQQVQRARQGTQEGVLPDEFNRILVEEVQGLVEEVRGAS